MDEEKEDRRLGETRQTFILYASRNLESENSNRDSIKRLDGLFSYTIDAWLHISGQERYR